MRKNMDEELKKKLYKEVLRLRMIEERIAEIYHDANEIKTPTHLYTGQEAIAVGACQALDEGDVVSTYHRSHGWYLAKGGDLNAMMAELFGKETGCAGGWGGSMHLIDVEKGVMGSSSILGGTTPHAVGCALAFQIKGQSNIALATFGDAGVEEGVFHECMNWASLKKLPVIFICENNLYSTATLLKDRQPAVEIYKRAESYGMPGYQIDGNDVVAVYEKVKQVSESARNNEGPVLIEVLTYRWREHVGPHFDYDLGYRSKQELEEWMEKCPVKRYEHLLSDELNQSLIDDINEEIDKSLAFARTSAFPRKELITNEI